MSKFNYDEDEVKGIKILPTMEEIIERNRHHEYTHHDLVKGLSDLAIQKYNKEDFSSLFDEVAIALLRQTLVTTAENNYYLREIEFYFYDKGTHEDSYAHENIRQQDFGEWYFHRFKNFEPFMKSNRNGVDITFGNKQRGIYGGALIRKIENAKTGELFIGINKVVRELIKNIPDQAVTQLALGNGQFAFDEKQLLHLKVGRSLFSSPIFKSPRHGLSFKNEAKANTFY